MLFFVGYGFSQLARRSTSRVPCRLFSMQCPIQPDARFLLASPSSACAAGQLRRVGGDRARTRDRSALINESSDRPSPYWLGLTPARLRETRRAANLAPTAKRCNGPKLLAGAGPTKKRAGNEGSKLVEGVGGFLQPTIR